MAQLQLVSSAGPKALPADGSRIAGDAYYTPDRLTRAAVAAVHAIEPITGIVWDPHVGGGAWVRALLDFHDPRLVWGSDIDAGAPGLSRRAYAPDRFLLRGNHSSPIDFMKHPGIHKCRWIFGNPPYSDALEHVERALTGVQGRHVVFLLRLAFVESQKRIPFWAAHPARHIWALAQRPSFTAGGGTDSAAYGLFWWDADHTGPTTFTPGWDWRDQPTIPTRST